ncbi:MAG: site-specific DNA-methyltransferase, partial [Halobacteria archaeon]|nr:site-specific DNA-methyltransferase [Halobacteria archaeon]
MSYELHLGNAFQELEEEYPKDYFHAIVTDPPYGVVEFETANIEKMRNGNGGIWRIPPEIEGSKRKPLPRFTVLSENDKEKLRNFFST